MFNKLNKIKNIKKNIISEEIPPGQFVTEKFPALTFGEIPNIDIEKWKLKITGNINYPFTLNWTDIQKPKPEAK